MYNFIEKLHGKPKHYRNKVAAGAAASVTALIALLWLSTLGSRLAATGDLSASNLESVAAVPFASDELTEQLQTIQGTINLLRSGGDAGALQGRLSEYGEEY